MNNLDKLYRHRFSKEDLAKKQKIWKVLCEDFFQQFIKPSHYVVDIGAGYGEFLNNINCKCRIAVDKTLLSIKMGHLMQYKNTNEILDELIDIVFMSNFLEHVHNKQEVMDILLEAKRILNPGGKIIILQPNIKLVGGAYWDFIDHHTPLTDKSIVEALESIDMKVTKVITRFLPYTTKSLLPQSPWLVRLYLKLPFLWWFFGKQSLVIAEKQ